MKETLASMVLLATLVAFSGCSNIGKNFDADLVKQVQVGKTTQSDIEKMFGQPYKKGVYNGYLMWSYEYDQYRALGTKASKDLTIVFDEKGVVKTSQIMSSQPLP